MHLPYRLLLIGAVLLIGACSSSSGPPRGDAAPPPSDAPFDAGASQGQPSAPAAPKAPDSAAPAAAVSEEKRKSDAEACYSYAAASVRNEARLDDDRTAGRGSRNSQVARYSVLTTPVNNYYYQKQQQRLFESCMQQKGYAKK